MLRTGAAEPASVHVEFTTAEKRLLLRRARDAGLPLADHIRERVLAAAACEEQALRYLVDELTRIADDNRRALADREFLAKEGPSESPSAQRGRVVKEVREAVTQREIASSAEFLKPAFDAGLWPDSSGVSQREES